MSDIKTKYTFHGNPECGRCSAKSGEYDYDPGGGHENCACSISIQSTRVECTYVDTLEIDRELIHTSQEVVQVPESGSERVRITKTYSVTSWIILDCVRVDARTGKELNGHCPEIDEHNFTDTVVGEWEERPSLEPILPEPEIEPIPN